MDIMSTENVCRDFPSGRRKVRVLYDVSLKVEEGSLTVLRGRSGSGKTTLLNIMSGLDDPTSGRVFFADREFSAMAPALRDVIRARQMGFVFQAVALIPTMSAYENVEFMLRIAGKKADRARVLECLDKVGLSKRVEHFPAELSGGEQQRVAIARAMVHRPRVIFADEPTAELDSAMGMSVMKLFRTAVEEGTTVVMTTHDTNIMELADMIYTLEDGRVTDVRRGGEGL
ncbi:MAG: ABC transporter ATP-binding protein [Eubacteriales bacterium]|nr:ABC transporter ATP-binding protein [Eubacteriales bacterium]